MKKWIVGAIALLIIVAIVSYFLTPSPEFLSNQLNIKVNTQAAYRVFGNQQAWDTAVRNNFIVTKRLLNNIELTVNHEKHAIPLSLLFIPAKNDSVIVKWQSPLPPVNGI